MTRNVDDIHSFDTGFVRAMERLEKADLSDENKQIINKFVIGLRREELAKSTILGYLNYITRTAMQLRSYNIEKPLTEITQDDFDLLMMRLEDEHGMKPGTIRTYKKMIKKFFRVLGDGEQPKWVQKLKLKSIETPVQPHDLLTKEELDKMMDACKHPRDKAMIAVLADSGMRIGALASCRIKHAEFNQYGAILYISQTSKSKKTTAAKGIPLTWSTGFLNQWIAVHPLKNDRCYASTLIILTKRLTIISTRSMV
jgi:integrase